MNRREFIGSLGLWSLGSVVADLLLESATAAERDRGRDFDPAPSTRSARCSRPWRAAR